MPLNNAHSGPRKDRNGRRYLPWAIAGGLAVAGGIAFASLPPAGASIGNQATAEYVDSSGQVRRVFSNTVKTVVQQVYGVDVEPPITKQVIAGDSANFPFYISNVGNGIDSFGFNETVTNGTCAGTPQVFRDTNSDGVPDGPALSAPYNTGPLEAGEQVSYVLTCTILANATAGDNVTIDITATSVGDDTETDTITDTAIISNSAVDVTKGYNIYAGPRGTEVEITLEYRYRGTGEGQVRIVDNLPVGFDYVIGSGGWTVGGTMTDGDDGVDHTQGSQTAAYDYDLANRRITATVVGIPSGSGSSFTFKVTVPNGYNGDGKIINIAEYNDNQNGPTANSNPAIFDVQGQAAVDFDDPNGTNGTPADADANPDDGRYTVDVANQGDRVQFYNVLKNNGDEPAIYNIVLDENPAGFNAFPGSSTPTLLNWDAATQTATSSLQDANGDNIPDTGVLQPGQVFVVVLEVQLDSSFSGDGPFAIKKTAINTEDPTIRDEVLDVLNSIEGGTVDMTNGIPGCAWNNNVAVIDDPCAGAGDGEGPGATPITTLDGQPGDKVTFSLYVRNEGGTVENYFFDESTDSDHDPLGLPACWTVKYFIDDNGEDDNRDHVRDADATVQVTDTGPIPVGGYVLVWAELSLPPGGSENCATAPGDYNVYFRARSNAGTSDRKFDRVRIPELPSVSVEPNQSADVRPGDCAIHQHWVANNGNVAAGAEGAALGLDLDITNTPVSTPPKFSVEAFWERPPADPNPNALDTNPNGSVDDFDVPLNPDEPLRFDDGLDPNEQQSILIKVCTLPGATNGDDVNTEVEICVTDANGDDLACDTADDHTEIIDAAVKLSKQQQVVASCSSDDIVPAAYSANLAEVKPGECICYNIVALNTSSTAPARDVKIRDDVPAWTTYEECNGTGQMGCAARFVADMEIPQPPVFTSLPNDETSDAPLILELTELPSSKQVAMQFCVQVDE